MARISWKFSGLVTALSQEALILETLQQSRARLGTTCSERRKRPLSCQVDHHRHLRLHPRPRHPRDPPSPPSPSFFPGHPLTHFQPMFHINRRTTGKKNLKFKFWRVRSDWSIVMNLPPTLQWNIQHWTNFYSRLFRNVCLPSRGFEFYLIKSY